MKYIFTFLAGILLSLTTLAQKEILKTRYNADGTIGFQSYDVNINPKALINADEFLKNALGLDPGDSMHLVHTIRKNGNTYLSYQQYYKGYKVLYATYAIQAQNDKIKSIHGYYKKIGTPSTSVSITEKSALETVLKYVPAIKYGWQDTFSQSRYKEVTKDSNATLYPKGTLVIVKDDSATHAYRLAYQFHIYSVQPLRDCNVYVDAITGNIISEENLILDNNTTGTASTLYSGTRAITMDSYSTPIQYRLQEGRSGINGATIQIRTYNMNNTGVRSNTDFTNTSTTWSTPDASLDVHWGTEQVCDYWSQVRNRNSYDGQAGDLIGYVHANLSALNPIIFSNNDNAFWDGSLKVMTYGDGTTHFNQVTSLDVIAHEIGHGICQHTAGLHGITGNWEPDALNEGLSDIWGAVIENWAAPNKQKWEIGEDIMKDGKPCLRSLQNPRNGGDPLLSNTGGYPDTYHGQFWDNALTPDPHVNSTVLSHWFYLLSVGGIGWNNGQTSHAPSGNGYQWAVNGVGIDKAAAIVWEAESFQINNQPSTDYAGMRDAMIHAATDLFCANSPEVIAVTNAWYAVGVGSASPILPMELQGDKVFCSTASYNVANLPSGAVVTWSASPSGIVSLAPNGNSVTATKITSGDFTLTASIPLCGANTTTLTKNITTQAKVITISAEQRGCSGEYANWYVSATANFPNATGWHWTIGNPANPGNITIQSPHSAGTWVSVKGGGGIDVTYTDPCGQTSLQNGVTVYNANCHSALFTISPNPATGIITIRMATQADMKSGDTKALQLQTIGKVSIFNTSGQKVEEQRFSTNANTVQMDVSSLTPGVYFVQVGDGPLAGVEKLVIGQ